MESLALPGERAPELPAVRLFFVRRSVQNVALVSVVFSFHPVFVFHSRFLAAAQLLITVFGGERSALFREHSRRDWEMWHFSV